MIHLLPTHTLSKLKPYLIVRVTQDEWEYIGETLSFPTPSDTIMVRRVPGHAGTLVELPLSAVTELPNQHKRRWVHYARVGGMLSFPVDMLRREHAVPVDFDPENARNGSNLLVAKVTESSKPQWNVERWRSFSWELTHVISEPAPRLGMREESHG